MQKKVTALVLFALLACMIPTAAMALSPYSEDFEGLNNADTGALAGAGWLVFANVFSPDGTVYYYGYGVFGAPNDGAAFSAVAVGVGGGGQGAQQLSAFSDYNNTDHGLGNRIEANVFQEYTVGPGDVGETWTFEFDAKLGNLEGATTAVAFIKTLDPNNGYATTNFITQNMTAIPTSWGTYMISILIDGSLPGQLLQIGFSNTASNYEGSGVYYDNINFYISGGVVATESATFGDVKSLFR
ncbi:MAG: hypothetical protein ACI9UK_001796 [Candidatus Krumholzibacteriia bacterium]|jgi:hypothetical protein